MKDRTWDDRLDALMDTWDDRLRGQPGVPDDASDVDRIWLKVRSLLRQCRRSARSAKFDEAFAAGLLERHLFCHPPLDGFLDHDTLLHITRNPIPEPTPGFVKESHLEAFLEHWWKDVDILRDLELVGRQFQLPSGNQVDLLFFDREANQYVVVELKAEEPERGGVSQVALYVDELTRTRAKAEDRGVRGLLLTGAVPDDLVGVAEALGAHYPIAWYQYELVLETGRVYVSEPTPS